MDFLRKHAAQLDYPPGDQRTARDGISWHLSEQHAEHVLGHGGRMQFDCSEACPWILKCAGMWHWSEPGYTGSHLQLFHDHYTDGKRARPGALVVMGLDYVATGKHEVIVDKADPKGGDPWVWSHGAPGVWHGRLSQIARGSLSGHVYLSIAHL